MAKLNLVVYKGKKGIWVRRKGGFAIFIPEEEIDMSRLNIVNDLTSKVATYSDKLSSATLKTRTSDRFTKDFDKAMRDEFEYNTQLRNAQDELAKESAKLDDYLSKHGIRDDKAYNEYQKETLTKSYNKAIKDLDKQYQKDVKKGYRGRQERIGEKAIPLDKYYQNRKTEYTKQYNTKMDYLNKKLSSMMKG